MTDVLMALKGGSLTTAQSGSGIRLVRGILLPPLGKRFRKGMDTQDSLKVPFTHEVEFPSLDHQYLSPPSHVAGSAQAAQERGRPVGEAIFGTLLIVLFGGMGLAVLFEVSEDWEDRQKDKEE